MVVGVKWFEECDNRGRRSFKENVAIGKESFDGR